MSYSLYHTLNKNLKNTDLSASQKKVLLEKLSDPQILSEETKKAIIMLVIEHAKTADGMKIDSENFSLPYNVKQIGKDVHIDIENLPVALKWILWKFMNLPAMK